MADGELRLTGKRTTKRAPPDGCCSLRSLDQATRAALQHTGEGRVSDTEVGDEDSYYEVEVTLDDGSQVDVQLEEQFNVVATMADDDTSDDDD